MSHGIHRDRPRASIVAFHLLIGLIVLNAAGCRGSSSRTAGERAEPKVISPAVQRAPVAPENLATATFAGGCFWCMEKPFDEVEGVLSTTSGYTGGQKQNPTYEEVSAGGTGHAESIRVEYDSTRVSYADLLEVFWRNIDPTTPDRQFCDAGNQYRSAIFYHGDEQRQLAEESKKKWEQSGRFKEPIVTEIVPVTEFYVAEDYHQDFYLKDPLQYQAYRIGCGRDRRLKELWGDAAGH